MRRAFLSLGVGLGILCGVTAAYAQRGHGGHGGGGHGFGGQTMHARPSTSAAPVYHPSRPAAYHRGMNPVYRPQPSRPQGSNLNTVRPSIRTPYKVAPTASEHPGSAQPSRSHRPSVTNGNSPTAVASKRVPAATSSVSTRPYKASGAQKLTANAKPSVRPGNGAKGSPTLTGTSKVSSGPGHAAGGTNKHSGGSGKHGGKGVLTMSNQAKMQTALGRLGGKIQNALLLSALANMACGQPLSGSQCGCLGQYLNSPDCGLTEDEQGCVQQCLGGDDDNGDNGDNGDATGDDASAGDANDNGSDAQDDNGVLIGAVDEQASAAQAGLRAGDVILSFGDVRTRTFDDLQNAVQQADGAVKVVFINGENNAVEYLTVEPQDGRIGVTCE